jgi:hypothetical protein
MWKSRTFPITQSAAQFFIGFTAVPQVSQKITFTERKFANPGKTER